jgi:hypothetical protein
LPRDSTEGGTEIERNWEQPLNARQLIFISSDPDPKSNIESDLQSAKHDSPKTVTVGGISIEDNDIQSEKALA